MDVCPDCGNEYQRIRQHFAMSDCGGEHSSKSELVCGVCGEAFTEWTYRVEKGDGKYCSAECRHKGNRTGKEVSCAWCGDAVYKPDCHIGEMGNYAIDHHFCNKECETEFKRNNWVREGHPKWQGGKAGVDTVRNSLSEKAWFRIAKEHRGQVCENCGAEREEAEREHDVHHIIPVSSGGTNHPDNLITLCISCHRKAEAYTKRFTEPHLLKPAL